MKKNRLTKRIVIALSLCLLITCLMVTVNAAGLSANTNDETAYRGETVTFHATLSESVVVGSGSMELSYDSDVLELTGGTCNVSGAMLTNFDVAKGKGAFAFSTPVAVSGALFTATFRVKDTAAFETTNVSLNVTLKDGSNAAIPVTNNAGSVTVKCNHSFTAESTDAKYLKSEANCTSPAVYFHSCASCGEKGTTTFTSGSTTEHSYTKQDTATKYLKSAATCTEEAVYYYSCTGCGTKGTDTFKSGTVEPHSYTKQDTSETYLKSEASCTEAATYYYCCATCTAKGTTTYTYGSSLGHTGGTATCTAKAVCTRCSQSYGETLPHTYTQKVESDTYLKENATCTHGKLYYKSCSCGAKGTETFEVGSALAHSFTAMNTAGKYLKSPGSCTEKAVYYYSCATCGEKGTEVFESGEAPSHNYLFEWSSDASAHWHECLRCGDKTDSAAHTPGAEPTETTHQTCTTCGYVVKPALGHTHSFGTEWEKDANDHWHACDCGEKSDSAAHTWDEGTVTLEPTTEEFGEKTFTCTVCGQTKVETIAVLEPETTEAPTTDEITTEPDNYEDDGTTEAPTNDEEGGCGSIVGGSALLLMVAMIAPMGAMLLKKKED